MKISRKKLKQIIAEELNLLTEQQLSKEEQQVVMTFVQTFPQLQEILRKIGMPSEALKLKEMTKKIAQKSIERATTAQGPVA